MSGQRLSLVGSRTYQNTMQRLEALGGAYPEFVHKWSKARRQYRADELYPPREVNMEGVAPDWSLPVIGIGGTRSPCVETFCLVSNVVRELAHKPKLFISGGVPGVDLSAHMAAADSATSMTCVVLANPVSEGFAGHEWRSDFVRARILERGCFISEHDHVIPFGQPAFRERLLDRDRIISAMCDIFLVFECNQDSATVDTAIRALSQGKTVVCVESSMRTAHRGTEQLVARGKVPWLQEKELGAVGIAAAIEAILADIAKPAAASAELASPVRG